MGDQEVVKSLFEWFNGPTAIAIVSLISATISGFGVQWLKARRESKDDKNKDEATFRKELREEVRELRLMVKGMDKELDEWKGKYYELLDDYSKLKGKYTILEGKYISVKQELDEMRKAYVHAEKSKDGDTNNEKV